MRHGMIIAAFLSAVSALAASAGECPASLDWGSARDIARGVKFMRVDVDSPRQMAAHFVRVDLREPGLRVTGSHRPAEWGIPMPDYTNEVKLVDARRQTVRDFLERHRAGGTNMVFAVNTSAWTPWIKPYSHKFGSFLNFLVSDGEVVSHTRKRCHMMVVFRDGTARITDRLDDSLVPTVAVAHPGYDTERIMERGRRVRAGRKQHTPALAPRTALGLSGDRRWFYALVVDGRQKGCSLGADMDDLVRFMKAAGASDALNMDGGGSATIVLWDPETGKPLIPNRHKGGTYRPVAASMGFYLEK